MNPLLPVYSQRTFLLDALNSLAESATAAEAMVASSLIEDCLVSLALEEMYHIVQVQGRAGYGYQGTVLDQALDAIGRKLYPSEAVTGVPTGSGCERHSSIQLAIWRHCRHACSPPSGKKVGRSAHS